MTVNFIGELMILVGSWGVYPVQTIVAVLGIALTLAYLVRMLRGVFFGPVNPSYAHVRDASPFVDRVPLLILAATSLYFGLFPLQFIHVIQAGVTPLIAKIQNIAPIISQQGGPLLEFTPDAQDIALLLPDFYDVCDGGPGSGFWLGG
jgi:NADH-quinone oxidoreductase subunit M